MLSTMFLQVIVNNPKLVILLQEAFFNAFAENIVFLGEMRGCYCMNFSLLWPFEKSIFLCKCDINWKKSAKPMARVAKINVVAYFYPLVCDMVINLLR